MNRFAQTSPASRVVFGPGVLREVGAEVERAGLERVLVVASASGREVADTAALALGARCAGRFDRAVAHVPDALVADAAALARDVRADGCLAIGGGSAVGLAKALALETGVRIVAVPTTYAGSEMTPIWGRTSDGRKTTGRDASVLPVAVLYDPWLTRSLPLSVSVTSGFNAVAHAAEALAAPDRSPLTDLAAEEGARLLLGALPRIAADTDDLDARSDALTGAWLCGTVLGATTTGLHHRICHVLGGTWDLPHAETHTVVLPYVVALAAHAGGSMEAALRRAGGFEDAASGLQALARTLGAPASLRALGLPVGAVAEAAAIVTERPVTHPAPIGFPEVQALLQRAFDGAPPG